MEGIMLMMMAVMKLQMVESGLQTKWMRSKEAYVLFLSRRIGAVEYFAQKASKMQ
jgi:hypothetical protein